MTTRVKKTKNASNTAEKQRKSRKPRKMPKGVPFKKNDPITGEKDERINRTGRPVNFDQLRALGQQLGHELVLDRRGKPILSPDGQPMTATEQIMRQMMADPKQRLDWLFITYGKPAERREVTGKDGAPLVSPTLDKDVDERINRAISSLANALGEIVSGTPDEQNSEVVPAEQTPVAGTPLPS